MPDQRVKLSVIIITLNEQENIRPCLESVQWADEIVVVDGGSEDTTIAICREFGATVITNRDWKGFGYQKNLALHHASGDWILSIDADERVSEPLQQLIRQIIAAPDAEGYALPRQAYFLGSPMRHGGWWPDYVVRLFRRDAGVFSDVVVHETVQIQGTCKKLREPLIHYSYISLEQLLDKINRYSSDGALQASLKHKRGGLAKALFRGGWAFFRAYCLRMGCLDGSAGLVAAIGKAEETYYRYLKLSFLPK